MGGEWMDLIMIRNFIYAILGVLVGMFSSIGIYNLFNYTANFDIPAFAR